MLSKEVDSDTEWALGVYFRHASGQDYGDALSRSLPLLSNGGFRPPMVSDSNVPGISAQEVYTRLVYNRPYVGTSVTDTLPGDNGLYKHQVLVVRQMFQNDSCLVVHDPGTGKTVTHIHVMLELLRARVISHIVIINQSENPNAVALRKMKSEYERLYEKRFRMPFTQFKRIYVKKLTTSKIGDYNYQPHSGIVIDEAHNLFSDSEGDVKKVEKVNRFLDKMHMLSGMKILLLSATPLFGDISSLSKFSSLLYRDREKGFIQQIPSALISYTQISYTHLNIVQVTNSEYPMEYGDRSFKLANGVTYPFKFYVSKPSPMQIADFAHLTATRNKAPFQSGQKPIIVSSRLHTVTEQIGGINVSVRREQSAIGAAIVELINRTVDGTIIIYCDLVEDGALAMARYLDNHGFESYTRQDNMGTRGAELRANPVPQRTRSTRETESPRLIAMENELTDKNRKLRTLQQQQGTTSQEKLDFLFQQMESIDNHQEDLYSDVYESIFSYTDMYAERREQEVRNSEHIVVLEREIERLREDISVLRQREGLSSSSDRGRPIQRYLLYLSTMSVEQKKAFAVFNSPDNWDGSRIKVVIGSRVMRDGVDVAHTVQTHIIVPEWRIPGYVQAQHRGIRSAGHSHLISGRAIKRVQAQARDTSIPTEQKITYEQAMRQVIDERVTVEIYNHFLDFRLLSTNDIVNARPFLDETPELRQMNDQTILDLLQTTGVGNRAGEAIIEAAIAAYRDVGAEMMTLRATALDYKLNVPEQARVRDAITARERADHERRYNPTDLLATKDVELFFMQRAVEDIITRVGKMLFERGYQDTDKIFDELLNGPSPRPTEQIIATALTELTTNRRTLYHPRLGIFLYVRLYELPTESIIYLCSTENSRSIHPYLAATTTLGYSTYKYVEQQIPPVTLSDATDLVKSPGTFTKLRHVLEQAIEGERPSAVELTFLIQLSNYWGFSWQDLAELNPRALPTGRLDFSVYVLEDHIVSPTIDCLARDLRAREYRPSLRRWVETSTARMHGIFLVRYASLVWLYRDFSFIKEPAFLEYYSGKIVSEQKETNGIIFVKDYYHPSTTSQEVGNSNNYVSNLFERTFDRSGDIRARILIKKFAVPSSRGRQVREIVSGSTDALREVLQETVSTGITLPFFLYDRDHSVRNDRFGILDIKLHEMQEMREAAAGTPSLRFKIFAVEHKILDPTARRAFYSRMYQLPYDLH